MSGRRPTLLLLHAFGASGRSFAPLAARLERVDVRTPDLPGFAGSPPLPRPSVAAYADWVEAYADRAGLRRAALGGWSMGGKIAVALAARRPAWLSGLVLIAPSPPGPEPMDEDDRLSQLAGYGDAGLARRSVTSLMASPPLSALVDAAVADRLAASESAWRWWLEEGSREDVRPTEAIAAPAQVLVGAKDPNLGEAPQRRLTLPALSDATLEVVADAGHFLPLEQPDALAERIGPWLETRPRRA